jgi:hypothetical protein
MTLDQIAVSVEILTEITKGRIRQEKRAPWIELSENG